MSEPVAIVVDDIAPTLGVSKVQRDGNEIRIVGRTELGATVRVNEAVVKVKPDGSFEAMVTVSSSTMAITIASTDAAGNTTSIVQILQP
jgi:hypothetical protein